MRDPTRDPKRDPITGIGAPFEKKYKIFYILDMNNNVFYIIEDSKGSPDS